jgi:hypothetical protein
VLANGECRKTNNRIKMSKNRECKQMGKQTLDRARKILIIVLLVLFAISVTAATVSADHYSKSPCKGGHWECGEPYYVYHNHCQGHWVCPDSYGGGGGGYGGY